MNVGGPYIIADSALVINAYSKIIYATSRWSLMAFYTILRLVENSNPSFSVKAENLEPRGLSPIGPQCVPMGDNAGMGKNRRTSMKMGDGFSYIFSFVKACPQNNRESANDVFPFYDQR
jgi:hypothetical protein